ncbi:MAG: 50S ribosomal protein L24 [Chloroflexi bacterium]|nr:50S ribosomal protein L24 [Chloroflexota bacterium]
MNIAKNDTVVVLTGRERGKRAKVRAVLPKQQRVILVETNIVKRHVKPGQRGARQAGIIDVEAPIHVSNVMLVCPNCGRPTRAARRVLPQGGTVRICKKCGSDIPVQWRA